MKTRSCISLLLSVAACTPGQVGSVEGGASTAADTSFTTRAIARAQQWVDDGVAYSFAPSWNGYRTDCSGLVSWAWDLAAPGHTTYSLGGGPWDDRASQVISLDELSPGDALNFPGDPAAGTGHVVLFAGWDDVAHDGLSVYQELNFGYTARLDHYSRETGIAGIPFSSFLPIRAASNVSQPFDPCVGKAASAPQVVGQSCTEDKMLVVSFSWISSGAGEQWLDGTSSADGFATGAFENLGPFIVGSSEAYWLGPAPGLLQFFRVDTNVNGVWCPSETTSIVTIPCN